MLPKQYRLSSRAFAEVRERGLLRSGRLMGVLVLDQPAQIDVATQRIPAAEFPQAGIIVSKKISNRSVVRNRLKRRLRAALIRVLPDLPEPVHLVVLPNRRSLDASFQELEKDLRKTIHQVNHEAMKQ